MSTAATLRPASPNPFPCPPSCACPSCAGSSYAQLISTFGDFLALFAVINFLTFHLNATPRQVTGLQIAYLLPIAVLGVLAGVFVDRWPLKPTMVGSDFSRAALCLLLPFATRIGHFYAILAAISVLSSFFNPAQGVAIRSAVPLHGLRSANSLMQQVLFGMRIIGPGLAGILYKLFGPRACYLGDAASFIASGSLIATLVLTRALTNPTSAAAPELTTKLDATVTEEPTPVPPPTSGLASILPDMKQGLSFIVHHAAVLFVILALAAGMFVIGCFGPLIAVYTRDTLRASTGIYATISAMIGLGMFLGVNALNTLGKKLSNTLLVFCGLSGIALGLCFLAGLAHVWAAILGDLIIGTAVAAIVVPSNVLIQGETPPALMGRVGSTVMSLVFTAQILGLILSGQLANRIGVRHVFAVCAVMLLVLVVAGKLFTNSRSGSATQSPAP